MPGARPPGPCEVRPAPLTDLGAGPTMHIGGSARHRIILGSQPAQRDRVIAVWTIIRFGFSFGGFVKKHPDTKGQLTDLLIGNLFNDHAGEVFSIMDAGHDAAAVPAHR